MKKCLFLWFVFRRFWCLYFILWYILKATPAFSRLLFFLFSVRFLNQFSCLSGFCVWMQNVYVQRERWGQTQENVLGAIILGNVKGLRQTLKARKFTVYSACQHLSTTGGALNYIFGALDWAYILKDNLSHESAFSASDP